MKFIVILTGGIGCGKTTVSKSFIQKGISVVDADLISHQVTQREQKGYKLIKKSFGREILTRNLEIDRGKLRTLVFNRPDYLAKLETILHPIIKDQIIVEIDRSTSQYIIISIPLFFEKKSDLPYDRILVVDSSPALQTLRVQKRSRISRNQIEKIMNNQVTRSERHKRAHDIILNEGSLEHLEDTISRLHQTYLGFSYHKRRVL